MDNQTTITAKNLMDFSFLSPEALSRVGAIYAPDMGQKELSLCQKHYLRRRSGAPTDRELIFLNALVAHHYRRPDAFLLSEMITEDAFLAATYADLMAKRAAVIAEDTMPCSLTEITKIAQTYLDATQKKRAPIDLLCFSIGSHPHLALAAKKMYPHSLSGNKASGLAYGAKPSHALAINAPLKRGDKIYIILQGDAPTESFEKALLSFAAHPCVIRNAKRMHPIGKNGVLEGLLALDMGFEINLPKLYGEASDAYRLIESDLGLLLVAKESDAAPMLLEALGLGLCPKQLGELRRDDRILLWESENSLLRFSPAFLRAFIFSRAYRAVMAPVTQEDAALPITTETFPIEEGRLFMTKTQGGNAKNAMLYAIMNSLSASIAKGASLKDVRLAYELSLSLDDNSAEHLGSLLVPLLELYRAITELALPVAASSIQRAMTEKTEFSLHTLALSPTRATPDTLAPINTLVHLLSPARDKNGNPDFESYREMLAYVSKLKQEGAIFSARAVTGDISAALAEMTKDTLVEYLPNAPQTAEPGSILIQATAYVFGTALAKITPLPKNEENIKENE